MLGISVPKMFCEEHRKINSGGYCVYTVLVCFARWWLGSFFFTEKEHFSPSGCGKNASFCFYSLTFLFSNIQFTTPSQGEHKESDNHSCSHPQYQTTLFWVLPQHGVDVRGAAAVCSSTALITLLKLTGDRVG